MFTSSTSSSSASSSSSSSAHPSSSFDFGLSIDPLPPSNPNPITTIAEEDEGEFVHIHQPSLHHHQYSHHHHHHHQDSSSYSFQDDATLYSQDPVVTVDSPYYSAYSGTATPSRSATSSPFQNSPLRHYSASTSDDPNLLSTSANSSPRYQYPRLSNSSGLNSNGGNPTGLPLYASRTQRMRNGSSSSIDHSGKPIYRGPVQPHIQSSSIGGLSSSSSGSEGEDDNHDGNFLVGGKSAKKRFATFKSRRGQAWYQSKELQIVATIVVLSLIVRLWAIGYPTSVVFDEVHFGGFASKYIRGRFFMDVHPPLAKMLIALVGWISGLDPTFDFKEIGMDYIAPKVPYVAMRLLGGLMGVAVVPMAFYTVKNSGHSMHAAILAAILVLFENGLVTQSRLILLDSPLVFFTAFTILAWTNFHNQQKDPFSDDWFLWLFLSGLGLGLSLSVKWVGLFVIATIGSSTLKQLWILWGDVKTPARIWLNHFIARAICLILVPAVVYMFCFEIHFLILGSSGDGDGFMSAPFQMTLGKSLADSPIAIAYGAQVTIRHEGTQGGYLHSHPSVYETGSKQQQITLYPHKDENNLWVIQKSDGTVPETLEYVKHNDVVRLMHVKTHKRMHSHDHKPPMTDNENHFEVSGYGHENFEGDSNDNWRLEIVSSHRSDKAGQNELHTLRSSFKLIHQGQNCDLFSHKVKLPKWGFEQQEVTCMRSAVLKKTTWMVESNEHPDYPLDAPKVNYQKPGFLGKFLELNKVMWTTNAGLTDSHPYDSRPSSWPWLRRGISFWGKDQKHIYLIGNWFTWYLSTACVALYAGVRVLLVLRDKRGYRDNFRGLRDYYEISGGFFFMGWAYHYLPFFLMDRQLFLHHYLPALYFSILLACVTFDLAIRFIPTRYRLLALIALSTMAILVFRTRAPLTFGSEWTRKECEASKVLTTWDYDCNQYPVDYKGYKPLDTTKDDPSLHGKIVYPGPAEDLSEQYKVVEAEIIAKENAVQVPAYNMNATNSGAAVPPAPAVVVMEGDVDAKQPIKAAQGVSPDVKEVTGSKDHVNGAGPESPDSTITVVAPAEDTSYEVDEEGNPIRGSDDEEGEYDQGEEEEGVEDDGETVEGRDVVEE